MNLKTDTLRITWSKIYSSVGFSSRRMYKDSSVSRKPVLYGDEASPPVRFVMITAKLLGIDLHFHNIDLFNGEHKTEFYKKINPLQKVPAIITDRQIICDSHAITLYLCRRADSQNLYPTDIMLRAKVDQMLYFNATTLFPIDSAILSEYFAGKWPADKMQVTQWYSAIDYMELKLSQHKWLAGDEMRLADICCATTLSSLGLLLPPLQKHVRVIEWLSDLDNLTCFDINTRGLKRLRYFIEQGPAFHKDI